MKVKIKFLNIIGGVIRGASRRCLRHSEQQASHLLNLNQHAECCGFKFCKQGESG